MTKKLMGFIKPVLFLILAAGLGLTLHGSARAEATRVQATLPQLTITPLTWNVVGLDSNSPATGPYLYPVGVKICNYSGTPATNVSISMTWTSNNPYIDFRSGSLTSFSGDSLGLDECKDFYFEIEVDKDSRAYDTSRRFVIDANATGFAEATTSVPREIFVEHLVSQNRNSVTNVILDSTSIPAGGSMTLLVGETYDIQLVGNTATNGYEQIESYINFPNTIFQINSVTTTYTARPAPETDSLWAEKPYADGCKWVNDPTSPNYRSCMGTGKYGGGVTVNYNVTIIGGGGTSQLLNTLIYDFSGSSYHYNSDYSAGARIAVIVDPIMSLEFSKAFDPSVLAAGGTSQLTFTIHNPTSIAVSEVHFSDQLPSSPAEMTISDTPNPQTSGCGTATFNPSPGAMLLNFTNGTIAGGGTCTISVNVSVPGAPTTGTYLNTSNNLFAGTTDTGKNAQASLTLSTDGTGQCGPVTMARWSFPTGSSPTAPVPDANTVPANVTTSTASTTTTSPAILLIDGNTAWKGEGFPKNATLTGDTGPYFQFAMDSSQYSAVNISLDYRRDANWGGTGVATPTLNVYSSTTGAAGSFEQIFSTTNLTETWTSTGTLPATSTGTGITYFRINATGARNSQAQLLIDNVVISGTGCQTVDDPVLSKSFLTDPIGLNSTSTLQFTIQNTNLFQLTGVQFSDALPDGLTVATTAAHSAGCGTLQTISPNTILFSDGTIAASASCNIDVIVTGAIAGLQTNVSGYVSSTQGGTNTDPLLGRGTDTLTVILPPSISKMFSPNPIKTGGTSTLTFNITNPNPNHALSDVGFSDEFPSGMTTFSAPAATQCNGTVTSNATSISLAGGSIAAGETCAVSVQVTASATTEPVLYENASEPVFASVAGNGNRAADTLTVNPIFPSLSLMKQVSTGANGPWSPFLNVTPGANVYYLFTVENTGDVPLSSISVNDPTVNTSGCTWTDPLPVAIAANENHIDTCVVGPIAAAAGETPNTATAAGSYENVPYYSDPASASVLGAAPGFSLLKQVGLSASGSWSMAISGVAPDTDIYYRFLVVNTGATALTDINVTDPTVDASACEFTNPLNIGGATACMVGPIAGQHADGTVTNTAMATGTAPTGPIDSDPSTASYTVASTKPDLSTTKTNSVSGTATEGLPLRWTIQVSNAAGTAVFADGQTILADPLPFTATDQVLTASVGGGTTGSGFIDCQITSGTVKCLANGGNVSIPTGGSISLSFAVTPDVLGDVTNTVTVDPLNVVNESNEDNNTGTDTVTVNPGTPAMTVEKAADVETVDAALDVITYGITVRNTGTTALTSLSVSDPLLANLDCDPGMAGNQTSDLSIPYGEALICTGSYTVLQSDIDGNGGGDGDIDNTVTADTAELDPQTASDFVVITRNPQATLTKTADADSVDAAGKLINYTITLTNTGNVTLTGVVITDPRLPTLSCNPLQPGPVAPTGTMVCTGSYTVTQADIDAGAALGNTATADSAETEPQIASETVMVTQTLGLTVAKTATPDTYDVAGESIDYSYVVTNSGNTTLYDLQVIDDKATVSCPDTSLGLAPSGTITCTASYIILQSDLDAGSVTNTAFATDGTIDSLPEIVTVNAVPMPVLTLVKNAGASTYNVVGEIINYSYIVTNDGNLTVYNIAVTDDKTTVTCPDTSLGLAPDDWIICTASYPITQGDLDAGFVTNTAQASAGALDSNTGTETVNAVQTPAMTIVKSATEASYDTAGDVLHYSYLVTNTGNVTLYNLVVIDNKATTTCPDTSAGLIPGGTITCSAEYTVSQADLDAGLVTNEAYATDGTTNSDPGTLSINALVTRALNIEKSASEASYDAVGDLLYYNYMVTNNGNVTLYNLSVIDDKVTASCPDTSAGLAPGGTITCTATYTITQDDLNAGLVTNTAHATDGTTDSAEASVTVNANQNPGLTIDKAAAESSYSASGNQLHYSFLVTNSGNIRLAGPVTVTDDKATDEACPSTNTVGNLDGYLDPGESLSCTASYTVSQDDVNSGSVTNIASAHAGGTDSATDFVTIYADQTPAITIDKTADAETYDAVGDVINYSYVVTNSGNTTLFSISVEDDKLSVSCPNTAGGLAPQGSITCNASYTIVQADLDSGFITNLAYATDGTTNSNNDSQTVNGVPLPVLTLDKAATPGTYDAPGDVIYYSYVVTNDGNVTLFDITVTDDKATVICPDTSTGLAPHGSITCSASYEITQADIDSGSVTNTAQAGAGTTASNIEMETVTAVQTPGLTIVKSSDPDVYAAAGDVIEYTYLVTNSGNTTLSGISVVDDKIGVTCPDTSLGLAPGGQITCSATYTVTQADLDNGSITNTAYASDGTIDSADDSVVVTAVQNPEFSLIKQANVESVDSAGDSIDYTITLTNTGNVTLTGVTITDPMLGMLTCSPTQPGSIVPNGSMVCTATYTVTQGDVDAGVSIDNTATADSEQTDTQSADVLTDVVQSPGLTIDKSAIPGTYNSAGDVINYSYVVTNSGNTTLYNLSVTDDRLSVTCPDTSAGLAPNGSITCTASHSITQDDLDSGSITNTAYATDGTTRSASDIEIVNANQAPALSLVKTATPLSYASEGDVINYSYQVINSGNVTLYGISVVDNRAAVSCPDTSGGLAPGTSITCTASYTIGAGDMTSGSVTNSAYATDGTTDSATDQATVTLNALPALTLEKTTTTATYTNEGDAIDYSYQVTNSGNVTLTDPITVDDDKATVTCPALPLGGLIPGESITCSASYNVTQEDVNYGEVTNLATAHSGTTTSNEDAVTVSGTQSPAIQITKTAPTVTFDSPQLIHFTYSLLVENIGNMDLGGIQVVDDLNNTFSAAASFSVESLSSSDFIVNPGYDGTIDTNLLDGTDQLATGGSGTVTMTVLVDTGGDADLYTNTAIAEGWTNTEQRVEDQDQISGPSFIDPVVTKAVDPALASVGDTVTYTITVWNNGTEPADNVIVTDILPNNLNLLPGSVTVTPNVGTIDITPPRTVTVNLGTVGVDDTIVITIQAIVNGRGQPTTNTVQLTTTTQGGWQGNLLSNDRALAVLEATGGGGGGGGDPEVDLRTRALPSTGFAPGVVSSLSQQPEASVYSDLGEVWVEIPSLNVKAPIVGVPSSGDAWDTKWLWNEAGWLNGSAFPGWAGNSALTGHVYLSNGKPGPFVHLSKLKWGDKIYVHAYGDKYTFEVRENKRISPKDGSVLRHEEYSWLTLITCNSFNPITEEYVFRIAVRAVLVKSELEK